MGFFLLYLLSGKAQTIFVQTLHKYLRDTVIPVGHHLALGERHASTDLPGFKNLEGLTPKAGGGMLPRPACEQ
jgi:hypothetical protein